MEKGKNEERNDIPSICHFHFFFYEVNIPKVGKGTLKL